MASVGHVQVHDLSKRLGETQAVDGISFEVAPGTLTCLLGPSGCGKTTTLRMIAGLLDPDAGDLLIDGRSMVGVPANRRPTSIVFQDYALFPHMTVRQNVRFGLRRRARLAGDQAVDQLLEVMSLQGVADRHPGSLSGGQQQRVALARSLALRPDVVLMDEPLSNLDAKVRITLRAELRRIQREFGTTIVYVTHDQEEAMAIADEIVVMAAGSAQQIASPAKVYREPATPFVADFIGLGSWLDASCTDITPDHAELAVAGGTVDVALPSAPHQPNPGGSVTLFVRPEHVMLTDPESSERGIVVQVRSRQFMGSFERLVFETSEGELVLMDVHDEPRTARLREGDTARVRFARGKPRVFDAGMADGLAGAEPLTAVGAAPVGTVGGTTGA